MRVEENVDLPWRRGWSDVNETKADSISDKINYQRPLKIGIAIPAHQGYRRPQAFQPNEQAGRAKVTEMPDLIDPFSQGFEIFR